MVLRMKTFSRPPIKFDEPSRLAALRSYHILDTPPDGAFDHVTSLVAAFFKVPIALVSFVDEDRIWFKSRYGLDAEQIARSPGLCSSAIYSEAAYVVRDAVADPRSLANPLVAGTFGLRFYAAAPLVTQDNHGIGTVNIIDFKPRDFSACDEQALANFAGIVMDQLELRLSARKIMGSLAHLITASSEMGMAAQQLTVCAWSKKVCVQGEWVSFDDFLASVSGLKITHGLAPGVEIE